MMGIYKTTIRDLRSCIEAFKYKKCSVENLQRQIWDASRDITALEERELQNVLIKSEADIESIIYTKGPDEFELFCDIAAAVEDAVLKYYSEK